MHEREYAAHLLDYTNNARLDQPHKQRPTAAHFTAKVSDPLRYVPVDDMTARIAAGEIIK